jgi:hypothetical protein
MGYVYLWENIDNNMMYIGSHKGNINDEYIGSGTYFKRAYNKNKDKFIRKILYVGIYFREYEDKILKKLDVSNNKLFYNLKNDAIGGWDHINSNIYLNKKRIKGISDSKKGNRYKHLDYDKNGINNPMFGKKHSEETKLKISKSRKNIIPYSKKIIELTDNIIFKSVNECANFYNITPSTMSVLIRGEIIKSGKCKNKKFIYG